MNQLTALIETTANTILDEWSAEAEAKGAKVITYVGNKLDELEDSEPEVCQTVSAVWLKRVLA